MNKTLLFFLLLIVVAFATEKNKETQAKIFSSDSIKLLVFVDAETKVFCWEDPKDLISTLDKKLIEECLQREGEAMSNGLFDCLASWFGVSDKAKSFLKELMFPMAENVDIERRDNSLRTPLMIACQFDAKEAVERLIQRGAKTEEIDITEQTALHFSASGCNECLEYLLQKDAKVNSQAKNGYSPLMIACFTNRDVHKEYQAVKMLICAGADTKLKDIYGKTALDYCRAKPECAQLIEADEPELIDDLPKVESKDSKFKNPFSSIFRK